MKTLIGALAFIALAPCAFAQNYPDRNIILVAPFPPGGPSDTTARMIVGPMAKALGQQIVVENVTGAGGTVSFAANAIKNQSSEFRIGTQNWRGPGGVAAEPP